jgi:Raf kinase inhibitor-like YbhB/YbcL family protein
MRKVLILSVIVMLLFLPACKAITPTETPTENVKDTILLSSSAFNNLEKIPERYSNYGDDVSPSLQWSNVPQDPQSFAIVMDDPDAWPSTFTHWIIFNIPINKSGLTEGIPQDLTLQDGSKQGKNDFGNIGYNGPRPPSGQTHHYKFTIYALEKVLDIEGGVSIQGFLKAISGHILAKGTLVGLYGD